MATYEVLLGDCRETLKSLPDASVHTVVTSPPYFGLRDYGEDDQIGLEETPDDFVQSLVGVFREVRRVLRDDGTVWLNLGDSYAGSGKGRNGDGTSAASPTSKQATSRGTTEGVLQRNTHHGLKRKDLIGIPWRVAFALQEDGWYLRQDIVWNKPNCMPEPVKDRCVRSHEYIFLLSKDERYFFDYESIMTPVKESSLKRARGGAWKTDHASAGSHGNGIEVESMFGRFVNVEKGARKRSVWTVTTKGNGSSKHAKVHFATFPPDLIEPCILAGCPEGGTVLDPFGGSGTTAGVALKHGRNAILCELNPEYAGVIPSRIEWIVGAPVEEVESQKRLDAWI